MANLSWKDRKRTSEHYCFLQIDLLWLVMWLKSMLWLVIDWSPCDLIPVRFTEDYRTAMENDGHNQTVDVKADLDFCCLYMPKDTFFPGMTQINLY